MGIKDGKIVITQGDEPAAQIINAAGKIVCPGFIDAHSHGDTVLAKESSRMFRTPQGITTEVTGQCDASRVPVCACIFPI